MRRKCFHCKTLKASRLNYSTKLCGTDNKDALMTRELALLLFLLLSGKGPHWYAFQSYRNDRRIPIPEFHVGAGQKMQISSQFLMLSTDKKSLFAAWRTMAPPINKMESTNSLPHYRTCKSFLVVVQFR